MSKGSIPTYELNRDYVQSLYKKTRYNIIHRSPQEKLKHEIDSFTHRVERIERVKETLGSEGFFIVVDIPNFKITEVCGLERKLGYSEKQFSLKQYHDEVLHDGQKNTLFLISQVLYEALIVKKSVQLMTKSFCARVALKHLNGNYVLAEKITSLLQYDSNNRLVAYIDKYIVLGEYRNEPLISRVLNTNGDEEPEIHQQIMTEVSRRLRKGKYIPGLRKENHFPGQQLQVARFLVQDPPLTRAEIASKLTRTRPKEDEKPIAESTVATLCRRLLQNANKFYNRKFTTAREAALHMHAEGLLFE